MKEFTFEVREILTYTAYVEANDMEEAHAKLEERYAAGEFPSHYTEDVEFEYKDSVELDVHTK